MYIFAAVTFLTLLTWVWNEWAKRSYAKYLRKEQNYVKLVEGLKGYDSPENDELKKEFIHQISLCWLNCPDDVIRKANRLLRTLNNDGNTKEIKIDAMGDFILTIRKDALMRMPWDRLLHYVRPQTDLNRDDYKELRNSMLRHIKLTVFNGKIEAETEDIDLRKGKRAFLDTTKVEEESAITNAKKEYEKFKKEKDQIKE